MKRILIVEDNERLADGLRNNLEYEGYAVLHAPDAARGLALAREARPDLVILDLLLPDGDGYRVLRALREAGIVTPVLILTALGEELEKVRGFRLGADDYVTKPFGLMELLARIEALLRRTAPAAASARGAEAAAEAAIRFGDVTVAPGTRTVTRNGAVVPLRPKEFDLLLALLRRRGRVARRLELLREVWGYDPSVVSRTVDTHMAELRRKLEADPARPRHFLTVRGLGYRLNLDGG
ncbi:MAG TPA: response regulator transcription factor [Gemmatimonadales bacterium]|nr:response regulator transcription factor [Gemmatimonadales bacterium]